MSPPVIIMSLDMESRPHRRDHAPLAGLLLVAGGLAAAAEAPCPPPALHLAAAPGPIREPIE
ncbi:MAG: hypothetical protein U1F06_07595, partial [Steroidobacteraceae bacterium]